MIVFRVEHACDGRGPYTGGDHSWGARESMNKPEPKEDGITDFIPTYHVSGFASHEQVFRWFTPNQIRGLRDYGFIVAQYEVDASHVLVGRSQVVFRKEEAILVHSQCPFDSMIVWRSTL